MKKTYALQGVDCADCARKIQDKIAGLTGVTLADVNFMFETLTLEADDARFDAVLGEAQAIIAKIEPDAVLSVG